MVERVDTEPLTADQHRDAAIALAVLVERWLDNATPQPSDRADLSGSYEAA